MMVYDKRQEREDPNLDCAAHPLWDVGISVANYRTEYHCGRAYNKVDSFFVLCHKKVSSLVGVFPS